VRTIRNIAGSILIALAVLWAASGLALAFAPRDFLLGEMSRVVAPPATLVARTYASPGGVIAQSDRVSELRLKAFLNRIVWEARGPDGAALFDAETAVRISPIDEDTAREVALREFAGAEPLRSLRRATFPTREYKGPLPAWRAEFSDGARTRLFISVETGEVVARRTLWSSGIALLRTLHFVDERGQANYASPWLGFAFAVLGVFILAAIGVLVVGGRRRAA
ncbi:MAG: hypothetical protein K2Q06_03040, partial [Parvularculaceae bacterium]|nr:hypothetical protein [Parvularculaceae bacterium]